MTREEFISLYEKCMAGKCTDAEKELLNAYQDDMELLDNNWDDDTSSETEIRNEIFQRLQDSRGINVSRANRPGSWRWLRVAASLVLVATAACFLWSNPFAGNHASSSLAKSDTIKSTPHEATKTYLTLQNGTRVILSEANAGKLTEEMGITVSKAKDGLLVYTINTPDVNAGGTDTTTVFNTITTPRGEQYQLILQDGTKVWLNAATSLKFPVAFKGRQRTVELSGEAYFEVARNKKKPFLVSAHGTTVQVLGTHFNVNAYKDDSGVITTLLEGSVRVARGKSNTLIAPGQQALAAENQTNIIVKSADIEETMAWKNGFFTFHNTPITEIMKTLARWYDIEVEYQGKVSDKQFGGTIARNMDVTEILNNMQLTGAIHYKIQGRRVIIME